MNKYERYKPSEIDWIGDVPSTWKVKRLKDFTTKILGGGTPNTGIDKYWDDEKTTGIPWVAIADITKAEVIVDTDKFITAEGLAASSTQLIEKGKILYSIYASLGKVAVASRELATNQAILSIYENPVLSNVNYLKYCLKGIEDIVGGIGSSTTQNNISLEKLRSIKFPLPTTEEQLTIANYLDQKTQKIDRLIANKKAQVAKLKELRQIEINTAVTKGLNPDAELKDSGIDWLGEIPKHWVVKRLKNYTAKIGSGITPKGGSEVYEDTGIPLFRSQNIHFDGLRLDDVAFITEEIHEIMNGSKVEKNDVLLNITGASIGRCYYYDGSLGEANVNQHVCIIRTNKGLYFSFIYYFIASDSGQSQIFIGQVGTSREGITFQDIKDITFALPPIQEQIEIANYLQSRTAAIDTLTNNIETQIERLLELRKITIYEAVTGKIKVNTYVEAEN